jgi:hypothetical protein
VIGARAPAPPGRPPAAARPRRRRWRGLPLAILALLAPWLAAGQRPTSAEVEAAFLRNFARYLRWPDQAFPDAGAPWRICVLGEDPFGPVLERTFDGRTEQGRGFQIVRAAAVAELPACQIVVIAYGRSEQRRAALAELRGRPVLTVGDAPGFLQEGGMIQFQVSDRVEFGVNLDQARAAALKVQAKVLEVAREVVENGAVRRRG